jgi:uncharacterized protein (DUF1800 family)
MPDKPIDPQWAWARYRPAQVNPWNLRKVGHLFRRAGFGGSFDEMQQALRDGPDQTIDRLLQGGAGQDDFEREADSLLPGIRQGNNGEQATAWWLYKCLYTPHPFREKMTNFWHDHFATSNLKVNNVGYMIGQYQLMRNHAQGNFETMLQEITLDPAMMIWLDTTASRQGQPNENYARELMELFSLGINNIQNQQANYTEQDIREAARAFTGYRIVNDRGVFQPDLHDATEKTVFGQRGAWRGPDIVRLCLERPASSYFITGKLLRFFVSETIPVSAALLEPLAVEFRRNWNIQAVMERILRSNLFFSAHAYRNQVKSPVDFAIGIARALEGRIGTLAMGTAMENLGQRLFYPPSVAGWDAGTAWLNGQTLLFRHNLALAMTSTQDDAYGRRLDPAQVARNHNRHGDAELVDLFLNIFLQGDAPAGSRDRLVQYMQQARKQRVPAYWTAQDAEDQRIRSLCHLVLTLPECQLN